MSIGYLVIGTMVIVVLFGLLFGILSVNANAVNTYDATLRYTAYNIAHGPIGVNSWSVSDFKKGTPLSMFSINTYRFDLWSDTTANIWVECNGEEVYRTQDKFMIVECDLKEREVTLKNIPIGQRCDYYIDFVCTGCSTDIELHDYFISPESI